MQRAVLQTKAMQHTTLNPGKYAWSKLDEFKILPDDKVE